MSAKTWKELEAKSSNSGQLATLVRQAFERDHAAAMALFGSNAAHLLAADLERSPGVIVSGVEMFLVGRYRGPAERPDPTAPVAWEFMGLFRFKDAAIWACTQREDFVAPVRIDERAPDESIPFEGAIYPRA